MISSVRNTLRENHEALCTLLDAPLLSIVRRAKRVWFNRDRLDRLLAESISGYPQFELIYAIDTNGCQMSSNIYADKLDHSAYRQDLSRRPYSVTLSVLNDAAYQGTFLCHTYVSLVTHRPCVTVMHGVTSGRTTLGFIAVDLDVKNLSWI